jgi:hypothetical protein
MLAYGDTRTRASAPAIHFATTSKTHMSTRRNTSDRMSLASYTRRALAGLTALAAVALMAACADAPSSPARPLAPSAPSLANAGAPDPNGAPDEQHANPPAWATGSYGTSLATPVVATGLLRTQPLAASVSVTYTATNRGGYFALPEAGLQVFVPRGAVAAETPLTMTVTALPGNAVAYEFQPHGVVFNKPLIVVQDLRVTNWQTKSTTLDVGYFAGNGDLDPTAGTALVRERMLNHLDVTGARLYWAVPHFSGYMVAWGFAGDAF